MRLSASQIETFKNCPRKWGWRYIEGIEEPPNASAEKGKAVHATLEKYLRGGEIDFTTEIGYIAASGLEHLPKPGTPGLLIEEEFHFEGPSGHTYLGYKDLELPLTGGAYVEDLKEGVGIVYDHKTTSDLRWQKTEDELRSDIQATLYAVDYFRNHPDEQEVELRWVYYQTKNTKKSAVTRLRVHQTETWNRFQEIEKIAEEMHAVSSPEGVRALDLPPNVSHCSAYGGCPHQGRCNLSPFDKMRSHVEQNKLTALLKNRSNGAAPPPAPQAAAQLPLAPAAAAPTTNKLLARMQAAGAPAPAAINPPEFQPPPAPPPVAPAAPPPAAQASPASSTVAPPAASPPATVEAVGAELAASLASTETAAPAARGRGRPPKAAVPSTGMAVKIKTLYLNCGPVGVAVPDATHFIVLGKKTLAEGGLSDYRFAEYGQGPGMLAVAVAQAVDALEGVLPALRLDTTTPEGSIVAVELSARAEVVVR